MMTIDRMVEDEVEKLDLFECEDDMSIDQIQAWVARARDALIEMTGKSPF